MVRAVLPPALALSILAVSCAPVQEDACQAADRRATLGNLLANSTSGAYDGCVSDLNAELAGLRIEQRALEIEGARLRAEAATQSGARSAASNRLADLNDRQSATLARISQVETDNAAEEQRLNDILAEERTLRARLAAMGATGSSTSAEADALRAEQDRLLALIDSLQ